MNYEHLVADFSARTMSNLLFLKQVQREHPGTNVYPDTQLINSMLGLLILPRERYVTGIPKIPLDELREQGWPTIRSSGTYSSEIRDLSAFVRYLRNAIAHFNIEFTADGMNQITGIKVWNVNKGGKRDWEAELTLAELMAFSEKFIDLLQKDASAA